MNNGIFLAKSVTKKLDHNSHGFRRGYGRRFPVPVPSRGFRLLLKNREREHIHSHSLFYMIS